MITQIERIVQSHTSVFVSVRIDVEPKRVEQTSPERFEETENTFIKRYPIARAPTEIIATAASPWIFLFLPERSKRIALRIVIGRTKSILFVRFNTEAIQIPPKAT